MDESSANVTAMGQAFDASQERRLLLSAAGDLRERGLQASDEFLPVSRWESGSIHHLARGDPASPEGIARIDQIQTTAEEALKGTPLVNAKIYMAGAGVNREGLARRLQIRSAGLRGSRRSALFSSSCSSSPEVLLLPWSSWVRWHCRWAHRFGLSVLVWQYILGINLHWIVLAMSVIILLAVGSDYNLLLVSRMKEEIGAGINTGIIRAMGGTGKVVTTAGLVFALTMASMVVSDLRIIGQIGTTIGLGLLFDTLIVRSFMTPSIAALLGRWFWWPQRVRPRPASALLEPLGPRPLVRSLLLGEERGDDDAGTTELPRPSV